MLRWVTMTGVLLFMLLLGAAHIAIDRGAADRDGAGITFVTSVPGSDVSRVRLYSPQSQLELTVFQSQYLLHDIAWSPDGERLYFTATRRQERTGRDLGVYDTRTGMVEWLVTDHDNSYPALSADGRWLVFSRNAVTGSSDDLFLLDIETGEYRLLYQGEGNDRRPVWSADDERIIFSGLDTALNVAVLSIPVWADDAAVNVRQLIPDGYQPTFSPLNDWIAFARANAGDGPESGADLYVYDAATRDVRLLLQTSTSDVLPSWSPDGSQVAYLMVERGEATLYSVDTNSYSARQLWPGQVSIVAPAWRP